MNNISTTYIFACGYYIKCIAFQMASQFRFPMHNFGWFVCVTKLLMTPEFNGPLNVRHFIMHCVCCFISGMNVGDHIGPHSIPNAIYRCDLLWSLLYNSAEFRIAIVLYTFTSYTVLAPIPVQHQRCDGNLVPKGKWYEFNYWTQRANR